MEVLHWRISTLIFLVVLKGCTVDIPGSQSYDLSDLQNQKQVEVQAPASEQGIYKYSASFCSDLLFCNGSPTNLIRMMDSTILRCLGTYGNWASGTYTKTVHGFKGDYTSSMDCQNDPSQKYSSTFNYICDTSVGTLGTLEATAVGSNNCKYSVDVYTDVVCQGSKPINSNPSSGLSGGSIFLIVLVTVICLYFLVGVGFNYYKDRSFKTLHGEFWCRRVPFWTKIGCMTSWIATLGCLKGTYRWCCIKIFKSEKDEKMAAGLIADKDDESS